MRKLNGIGNQIGYSIGTAVVKGRTNTVPAPRWIDNPAEERKKFEEAREAYEKKLSSLIEDAKKNVGQEAAEIFESYQMILGDDDFFEPVFARLEKERLGIECLIYQECCSVKEQFASIGDPYLQERAVDIENVCNELITDLTGSSRELDLGSGTEVIIVADDLTPAETIKLDKTRLRGFVTETGGITSHTVILAKTLGIPAIVGVKGALEHIRPGDELALDALSGTVVIAPEGEQKSEFLSNMNHYRIIQNRYASVLPKPAVTLDGVRVRVNINAGDTESVKDYKPEISDGVGLFRTEFLYMGRDSYPTEEEQFTVYREIAEKAGGKEVIIRTLDIGGDKQAAFMDIPKENNPFLGYRAIRFCLDRTQVFQTQLRAILRAAYYGNVKIMFPMIVTLEELRAAKAQVELAKSALRQEKLPFQDIPVGIMMETPAAVLLADQLAREADFFSVGSNDLIQYTTATDRMNPHVRYLYDGCNLSVLRSIHIVSQAAKAAGIPWGICGEAGSEDRLIPLWVALGVSELSVSPSQVGKVKYIIDNINNGELFAMLDGLLNMDGIDKVKAALDGIVTAI